MGRIWQFIKCGKPHEIELFRVDIFNRVWKSVGKSADVKHPETDALVTAPVYKSVIRGTTQKFAALELEDGRWAFYV